MKNVKRWSIILIFIAFSTFISHAGETHKELALGDTAPSFQAKDDNGKEFNSEKLLGEQNLVIYFYPAAMTGGCTKQACAYRDASAPLEREGIHVVGVSADPVKSLKYFHDAHGLNFQLLSDVNGFIAKRFGVPIRNGGSIKRTVHGKEVTLERPFTFVSVAEAPPAERLSAAVVVRNDVVFAVRRVSAGTDPCHRRHFGAWWARLVRAPTTTAQEAVDRAVAPVLASRGVSLAAFDSVLADGVVFRSARDRQQWQRRAADEHAPEARQPVAA